MIYDKIPPLVSLGLRVLENPLTQIYGNLAGKFSEAGRAGRNNFRGQSKWDASTSRVAAVNGRLFPTLVDDVRVSNHVTSVMPF